MSNLHKRYKTDVVKEQNGIPVEFDANDDGSIPKFYIARMGGGNEEYLKAFERETKPHRRQMELGTLNPNVDREIYRKIFVSAVLKGWENVQNEKGELIPYTEENALALLRELPDLQKELSQQAANIDNFRQEALQAEAKN
jgi:hypothetical protein